MPDIINFYDSHCQYYMRGLKYPVKVLVLVRIIFILLCRGDQMSLCGKTDIQLYLRGKIIADPGF